MSNTFKELREKRGLSQADVADFIGISRQMYNKYENGEVEPSLKAVKALSTLYAVSYEELLNEEDSAPEENSQEKKSSKEIYSIKRTGDLSVESPSAVYTSGNTSKQDSMYGTTNVLAQILELLPKLLYSEKAKLLTTVAQSMSNDVEAGQLAKRNRPERLSHEEPRRPTYEEFEKAFEDSLRYAKEKGFNSHGIKWTREDMHER